jgi:hypothetical protein
MKKTPDSWQVLRTRIAVLLILLAAGCARSHEVREPDRRNEYVISCWLFGWYICYEEANRLCPERYKVLSEKEGFAGRELRIACPQAP